MRVNYHDDIFGEVDYTNYYVIYNPENGLFLRHSAGCIKWVADGNMFGEFDMRRMYIHNFVVREITLPEFRSIPSKISDLIDNEVGIDNVIIFPIGRRTETEAFVNFRGGFSLRDMP